MVMPLKAQPHPDDELVQASLKTEAPSNPSDPGEADTGRNRVATRWDADAGQRKEQS
jgi:hypothetical protein